MSRSRAKKTAALPVAHHAWRRYALFAARCAAAASVAQNLAECMNLSYPVWATLSALVVSQERLTDTRSSLLGRLLGTLVGMAVAVVTHQAAIMTQQSEHLELLTAVAVSAVMARRWPMTRACMWTAVIVLASPKETSSIPQVAMLRGIEVGLGSLCGAGAHYIAEWIVTCVEKRPKWGRRSRRQSKRNMLLQKPQVAQAEE